MAITNQVEDPCTGFTTRNILTGGGGLIVKEDDEDTKEVHFFSPKS